MKCGVAAFLVALPYSVSTDVYCLIDFCYQVIDTFCAMLNDARVFFFLGVTLDDRVVLVK
jgi:hypothetical protein